MKGKGGGKRVEGEERERGGVRGLRLRLRGREWSVVMRSKDGERGRVGRERMRRGLRYGAVRRGKIEWEGARRGRGEPT